MNGFYGTKLDMLLSGSGVEMLIITAAWTEMWSIDRTAHYAADARLPRRRCPDGTSTINDQR
jgi:nicotinamidase-related amidase